MKYSNPCLFDLDSRHIVRYTGGFVSAADPNFLHKFRLRPELKEWLEDNNIQYMYGESMSQVFHQGHTTLYFYNVSDAVKFKLAWL